MDGFSPALSRFATGKSFFAFLGLFVCCGNVRAARPVWIDTDVAVDSPFRDVDDAFALIVAWHSPELRVVGISTTFGNASLSRTTASAHMLASRFSPAGEQLIYSGARNPRDIARVSEATLALIAASKKQKLTYIAIGPLTNLAAAMRSDPALASRLDAVIAVAGESHAGPVRFGRWLRVHDANVTKDPGAVENVLARGVPLTLVPIENAISLFAKDFRELSNGGDAAKFLYRRSRTWFWFWTRVAKISGAPVFDAGAILAAAQPEMVESEKRFVKMSTAGNCLTTREKTQHSRPVKWCLGFKEQAKRALQSRLLRPRSRSR